MLWHEPGWPTIKKKKKKKKLTAWSIALALSDTDPSWTFVLGWLTGVEHLDEEADWIKQNKKMHIISDFNNTIYNENITLQSCQYNIYMHTCILIINDTKGKNLRAVKNLDNDNYKS